MNYESDLRNYEHYLSSSKKSSGKKIQGCTSFEPMTIMLICNKPVK